MTDAGTGRRSAGNRRHISEIGAEALRLFNAKMWAGPKCGAKTRSHGGPCRKPGTGNGGRCHLHGGATPRGDDWHRVRVTRPKSASALTKIDRKLVRREKEAQERAKRVAAMTPQERARHEAWQKSHRPGKFAARAAARAERRQAEWLRGIVADVDKKRSAGNADVEADDFRNYKEGIFG